MRLKLLHFHAIDVADISRTNVHRRRWSQRNLSENRNIQGNQSTDILSKIPGLRRHSFLVSRRWRCRPRLLKVSNSSLTDTISEATTKPLSHLTKAYRPQSLTHSPTHSLTHSLIQQVNRSLNYLIKIYSINHWFIGSFIIYSITCIQ